MACGRWSSAGDERELNGVGADFPLFPLKSKFEMVRLLSTLVLRIELRAYLDPTRHFDLVLRPERATTYARKATL